jgi:hypothetical protein
MRGIRMCDEERRLVMMSLRRIIGIVMGNVLGM